MLQTFKKLFNNKTYVIVILLILCLLPISIPKNAQSDTKAIVVAVGIDLKDETYEVSAQVVIPTQGESFIEKLKVVAVESETVAGAIDKLAIVLGKDVGLAHCNIIVVGDELAYAGIENVLDYFIRTDRMDLNSVLINTKNAYDLLETSSKLDNTITLSLQNIVAFNEDYLFSTDTNLDSFYKGVISKSSSCFMCWVDVLESSVNGITAQSDSSSNGGGSSSSGSSSSGASGSSSSENSKVVSNQGYTSLFKNGKKVKLLTPEETKGLNWINFETKKGTITVTDIFDNHGHNETAVVAIKDSNCNLTAKLENNKPIIEFNINVTVKAEQIYSEEGEKKKYLNSTETYISNQIKLKIEEEIKNNVNSTIQILKENNVDIIRVFETFYKFKNKDFKKLLKIYGSVDEIFHNTEFRTSISVKGRL